MFLIIDSDKAAGEKLRRRFYKLGINCFFTVPRNFEKVFSSHPFSGVLIPDTGRIPALEKILTEIRKRQETVAVVGAADGEAFSRLCPAVCSLFDNILKAPAPPIRMAEVLYEVLRVKTGRDLSDLITGPVRLNLYDQNIFLCSHPVTVSISELLILRYLSEEYPRPVSDTELAKNTGDPPGSRKEAAIRTHISNLNAIAKKTIGRPCVINIRAKGYTVAPRIPE